MKNNKRSDKWGMFASLPIKQQLELIEGTVNQGIFADDTLREVTGQNKEFILNHFKQRGYELKGNHFIKLDPIHDKTNSAPSDLQVYADIHRILSDVDMNTYIRTSMSFAKETQERLDRFLSEYKLLKKQDIITAAIELFLDQYKK